MLGTGRTWPAHKLPLGHGTFRTRLAGGVHSVQMLRVELVVVVAGGTSVQSGHSNSPELFEVH